MKPYQVKKKKKDMHTSCLHVDMMPDRITVFVESSEARRCLPWVGKEGFILKLLPYIQFKEDF